MQPAAAFWKGIQDVWAKFQRGLLRTSSPLFLTEFNVPTGWNFPKQFKAKEWTGLLVCQVIGRDPSNTRLLAWWNSPDSFNVSLFQAELGLQSPVFQGVIARRKSNLDQWQWRKIFLSLFALLGWVVAVFSNINQFAGLWNWAYAHPHMALSLPQEPGIAVLGEPYQLVIEVDNRTHRDCQLSLNKPNVEPHEGLEFRENDALSRKLTEGAPSQTITYNLYARKTGKYQIIFSGSQHAGAFLHPRRVRELRATIQVWSPIDAKLSALYKWPTPTGGAVFEVIARHGHPSSTLVTYQAVLNRAGFGFTGVSPGTIIHKSQGGGVTVIVWQADANSSHVPQEFRLTLNASSTINEESWRKLENEIRVDAQCLANQ